MWHPPERIKHPLPSVRWPSASEAKDSLWFRPINIGSLTLPQRTWIPAMVPWRATEEGFVTEEVLDWYERFAKGQPGAIVVEATGVRDIPSGPLLRIGHDRFLPGLEKLVKTVHQASEGKTKLLIQIIDFLTIKRRPVPEKFFQRFLTITDKHREKLSGNDEQIKEQLQNMPDDQLDNFLSERELEALRFGYRERVTDTEKPHIQELPNVLPSIFAKASRRAKKAGFDGVELHYAHAYTLSSFLSAKNTRNDGYGGSKENRIKLPLEVYQAVRQEVGEQYVVGCRFLSDEIIDGGSRVEDAIYFGKQFARAGMDFLSLSRGGKFEDAKKPSVGWAVYPYTGPSGYECMPTVISDQMGPFGRNIEPVAKIRSAIREEGFDTPVVVVGGIYSFEQAESILSSKKADIVGSARQSLADPDWFRKILLGAGKEIRRCEFTNYCEGLDQKHKQVTCKLWDRKALDEPNVKRSKDNKRRLLAPDWKPTQNTSK